MKQKIIDRKDLPFDFWNYHLNPITGFPTGRFVKPFRPEQLNKYKK
jgi:hypothetical protein